MNEEGMLEAQVKVQNKLLQQIYREGLLYAKYCAFKEFKKKIR